jgi:hypothetical protein
VGYTGQGYAATVPLRAPSLPPGLSPLVAVPDNRKLFGSRIQGAQSFRGIASVGEIARKQYPVPVTEKVTLDSRISV